MGASTGCDAASVRRHRTARISWRRHRGQQASRWNEACLIAASWTDSGDVMFRSEALWPELVYSRWKDTIATLQLWTQIVGKVRLALTPWLNHSWHVPLYVSARGLRTSEIHVSGEVFEIEF